MVRRAVVGLALVCGLLAGCTTGPRQDYKYRVAVVPKGLTHEFWQSIHRGADRAAADLKEQQGVGVEVVWEGPSKESDAQEQIKILDRMLAAKVHGIVLAPQHSKQMVPKVKAAVDQGVPVVIIDSGLDDESLFIKYVATDNYHGGRLAAERLLQVLADDGKTNPKIVMIRYQPGSESTEQREKGFEDVVAEQEKAGKVKVEWLSKDQYAGATVDSARAVATPLLSQLRDKGIDGVFAPNESSAHGTLTAMRSLKLNKQVRLVGFDSSDPLLDALREGDLDGLVVQDPYKMGYLGVWTLVHHLEGYDVAPDGKKVQSTGEHLVTRDNLDQPETRERSEKELQAKRKVEAPKFEKK